MLEKPVVKTTIAFDPSPTVDLLLISMRLSGDFGQAGHQVVWFLAPEPKEGQDVDPQSVQRQPDIKLKPGVNNFTFDAPVGTVAQIHVCAVDVQGNVGQTRMLAFQVQPHTMPMPVGTIFVKGVKPKLNIVGQEDGLEFSEGTAAPIEAQWHLVIIAHDKLKVGARGVIIGVTAERDAVRVAFNGEDFVDGGEASTVVFGIQDDRHTAKIVGPNGETVTTAEYINNIAKVA